MRWRLTQGGDDGLRWRLIHEGEERTYVLVFDTDDEVASGLAEFARAEGLDAGRLSGIGALSDATLGFFDWETKSYVEIPFDEQVEVLSLVGDIASKDGAPEVHAHLVVSDATGRARGGHLLRAFVRPTLEVVVVESPAHLVRRHDDASGLALIDLSQADDP
jgi:uncharacterized protein